MDKNNSSELLSTSVKVGAPVVILGPLVAPVAIPVIHGLTGVAVVGLGLVAAGTLVGKAFSALSGGINPRRRQ